MPRSKAAAGSSRTAAAAPGDAAGERGALDNQFGLAAGDRVNSDGREIHVTGDGALVTFAEGIAAVARPDTIDSTSTPASGGPHGLEQCPSRAPFL